MQKHEEWLCERLPEWEAEGLIDSASAERLRGRYKIVAKTADARMYRRRPRRRGEW